MRPTTRYETAALLAVFGTILLWALWLQLFGEAIIR
jgi:hypothetical protein